MFAKPRVRSGQGGQYHRSRQLSGNWFGIICIVWWVCIPDISKNIINNSQMLEYIGCRKYLTYPTEEVKIILSDSRQRITLYIISNIVLQITHIRHMLCKGIHQFMWVTHVYSMNMYIMWTNVNLHILDNNNLHKLKIISFL